MVGQQRALEHEVVRHLARDAFGRIDLCSSLPNLYAPLGRRDGALLEQHPERALNTFLLICVRRRPLGRIAVVAQRQEAAVLAEQIAAASRPNPDFLAEALPLQADIDAVVLRDAGDIAPQSVADRDAAEKLIAVEHAPMAVLDDDPIADRDFPRPPADDTPAGLHRHVFVADEALELAGRHAAPRDIVFVEVDYIAPARVECPLLVAVGQEQILP